MQFKKFLDATHYHPQDDLNFLRDWKEWYVSGGLGQQAGDLGLARRCSSVCRMGGKTSAARMGMAVRGAGKLTGACYPWGNDWNAEAVPVPDKATDDARVRMRSMRTRRVQAHSV